ncbi:hypothetical protein F2X81_08820 [Staphylococcus aureus]|nr:hypothetical protein CU118_06545 [Staphylococcus aureus]MSN57223.1 hypothetical protein [Staphylococcus aureus]MSN63249.1 hypothetical protein [Staphylococcus aureus]MSN65108.1 hypothetical protein [Staphylococcus aureus]MSN71353.1 hypothetical protein [Staphylococcus aureus]
MAPLILYGKSLWACLYSRFSTNQSSFKAIFIPNSYACLTLVAPHYLKYLSLTQRNLLLSTKSTYFYLHGAHFHLKRIPLI